MDENKSVIGIDLGMLNTCIAIWKNGSIQIFENHLGKKTIPTFVSFTNTKRMYGEESVDAAHMYPDTTIYHLKRLIGRTYPDGEIQSDIANWRFNVKNKEGKLKIKFFLNGRLKEYNPEEILAMFLSNMIDMIENQLGTKIEGVVISVPAHFNQSQRTATVTASQIAGINLLGLINEPTAAALGYALQNKLKGTKHILVFDIGAGKTDCSIVKYKNKEFIEVIATAGDTHTGGEDISKEIYSFLVREFEKVHPTKLIERNPQAVRRLKAEAEKAKCTLSYEHEVSVDLDKIIEDINFNITLTRSKLESICFNIFESITSQVQRVLNYAKISDEVIDEVLLVGGSTRIPKIRDFFCDFFKKPMSSSIDPDEAIAYGAALQAAIINRNASPWIENFALLEVTPLTLGIKAASGEMAVLIKRNTKLPCSASETFTTDEDNQVVVSVKVYEGERTLCKNNHLLGTLKLKGILPLPRGIPQIKVNFSIDVNGILHVTTEDFGSHVRAQLDIKDGMYLSPSEIQLMLLEAEIFRETDRIDGERLKAKNRLKTFLLNAKETAVVAANDLHITSQELNDLTEKCDFTLDWLADNKDLDADAYDEKLRFINSKLWPIIEHMPVKPTKESISVKRPFEDTE